MRVSCRKNDKDYMHNTDGMKILLDGVPIDDCITADEERGEALCYVRGPDESILIDYVEREPKTEMRTGIVKIILNNEG